jgi:hypothetical protein
MGIRDHGVALCRLSVAASGDMRVELPHLARQEVTLTLPTRGELDHDLARRQLSRTACGQRTPPSVSAASADSVMMACRGQRPMRTAGPAETLERACAGRSSAQEEPRLATLVPDLR